MPKCPWDVDRLARTVVDMTTGLRSRTIRLPGLPGRPGAGKAGAARLSPERRRGVAMEDVRARPHARLVEDAALKPGSRGPCKKRTSRFKLRHYQAMVDFFSLTLDKQSP